MSQKYPVYGIHCLAYCTNIYVQYTAIMYRYTPGADLEKKIDGALEKNVLINIHEMLIFCTFDSLK